MGSKTVTPRRGMDEAFARREKEYRKGRRIGPASHDRGNADNSGETANLKEKKKKK